MEKAQVVCTFALPANEQSAKTVVPAIGALDDPTTRLTLEAADQFAFTSATNVRMDASVADGLLRVPVVVALVEAEMLRTPRTARSLDHNAIERRLKAPLVVDVGAGDLHGNRDPAAIGQDMAFDAEFGAVRRVRAGEVPPFGAFTMALSNDAHCQSMPRRSS